MERSNNINLELLVKVSTIDVIGCPTEGERIRLCACSRNGLLETHLVDRSILFIGFNSDERKVLRDYLQFCPTRANTFATTVSQLYYFIDMKSSFSHLIINFDNFQEVEQGIDLLKVFRKRNSETAIILVSSTIAEDDFAVEQELLCDVALRKPTTLCRLRRALVEGMMSNNESYAKKQLKHLRRPA